MLRGLAQMPVKPRSLPSARICASALVLCLSLQARAQDGGVVLDAPRVVKLTNGHYDFNAAAFLAVDAEMRRLQAQERAHKAEPAWYTPVLVGLSVGLTMGLLLGATAVEWVRSALSAEKPSR